MVITSDEVLFQLKRSILEYGLKHRIDYLVYSWLFSFKKVLISILISDNITFKLIDFLSEHRMYPIV